MLRDSVDLVRGSVLHIGGYASRGHRPKNKHLLVIGCPTETEAIGFLISSQLRYLHQDYSRNEVVRIPQGATPFLRVESIIQCFSMEYVSIPELQDGFRQGRVTNEGRLQSRYLYKVRDAVKQSRLLSQIEIETALSLLP